MPSLHEIITNYTDLERRYLVRTSPEPYEVRNGTAHHEEQFVVTASELRALLAIGRVQRGRLHSQGECETIFKIEELYVVTDDQEFLRHGVELGAFPLTAPCVKDLKGSRFGWHGHPKRACAERFEPPTDALQVGQEWAWLRARLSYEDWKVVRRAWDLPKVKRLTAHTFVELPRGRDLGFF